ncbi:hypothetical protein R6Z07M_003498 [Ovis aries]
MRRQRRRRRRRAAGGAGRGRAEDGVTWAGPAARDTRPPPPTPGGGPERRRPWTPWPAGLASPRPSPAGCPGVLAAGARSRHAWLRVAWLGRARERRAGCPSPTEPGGQAGTAPPARRCGHCSAAPPPHPSAGAWEPDPARPRRTRPSAAVARAHLSRWRSPRPGPSTRAAHPGGPADQPLAGTAWVAAVFRQ